MIWAHFFSFSCSMIGRVIGGVCGGIDQINKFPSTPLRHPPLMMIKIFFPQNFSPFLIKFLIKEGSIRKLVMLYRITHFWKSPKSTTKGREFLFSFKTVVKHYSKSLFEKFGELPIESNSYCNAGWQHKKLKKAKYCHFSIIRLVSFQWPL